MQYRATIHTMEIEPILPNEYADSPGKWIQKAYQINHPCVTSLWMNRYDSRPRAIINTHRLHTTPEGKYIFTYGGLQEHQQDMQTICQELEIDGYIIHRLDVCLDTDVPYAETQKLTRLIALLLGDQIGMENRYISIDPVTFEPKTLRLDNASRDINGGKVFPTRQIEHYNRELIDQTSYTGEPIINRFELRAMGAAAGKTRTEGDIVSGWIEQLDSLSERDTDKLCQRLNECIVEACGRYTGLVGNAGSTEQNNFIKAHADHIYTRQQLINLLGMLGDDDPKRRTNNLKTRTKKLFQLYKRKQIQAEIDSMKAALVGFLWADKNDRKRVKIASTKTA